MAKLPDGSPEIASSSPLAEPARQFEALLEVSETIAQQRDLKALFHELSQRLRAVLQFDFLGLILHDAERDTMRLHVLEAKEPLKREAPEEVPASNSPSGWVFENQELFLTQDTSKDPRYPDFMQKLQEVGAHSVAILPLTTAHHRLGTMVFGRYMPQGISEAEIQFMKRAAAQVAVAVDNALNFEAAEAYQKQLARERHRLQVLLDINNLLVSTRDPAAVFKGIVSSLKPVIQHDYTSLALLDTASGLLKIHALDLPGNAPVSKIEVTVPLEGSPSGMCFSSSQVLITRGREIDKFQLEVMRYFRDQGVQAICCVPLMTQGHTFGTINLASRKPDAFTSADVELIQQVAAQVAIALENALAFKEIDALKDKLAVEKLYLEEEIRNEFNFEEIIGESSALRKALGQVELAAPANTTVLLTGETGTGKELFARAIHNLSPRQDRTFVKVNCAAIPAGLLESELFGHERGAFTGAITQKVGRFELADKGSIFLDEVGDIPLELQPKLLRVLQEGEFERLGSTRTQKVDVRVIAATHRDLKQMIEDGQFRSDLYYRLHVFPLTVPPLRDRCEDIPLLVRHYVDKYARGMNRRIETIPSQAMEVMATYSWPGNVRELQNFIERAVILSPGSVLRAPLAELKEAAPQGANSKLSTHEDAERDHILRALRESNWILGGPDGAAVRLGMKRTTLAYRIRKLKIPCRPQ